MICPKIVLTEIESKDPLPGLRNMIDLTKSLIQGFIFFLCQIEGRYSQIRKMRSPLLQLSPLPLAIQAPMGIEKGTIDNVLRVFLLLCGLMRDPALRFSDLKGGPRSSSFLGIGPDQRLQILSNLILPS